MLDPNKLKVGSKVRLEGTVTDIVADDEVFLIEFSGHYGYNPQSRITKTEMQHAELVSTPVTFDKEQINQFIHFLITLLGVKEEDRRSIIHWLKAHEDKISTDTH